MATQSLQRQKYTTSECRHEQCVKEDHVYPIHNSLSNTCHVSLEVNSDSNPSNMVLLMVVNGSTGIKVPLILNRTDTVKKLKEMFQEIVRPNFGEDLHFAYNGKVVESQQTMAELGVKTQGHFITYQRCIGG